MATDFETSAAFEHRFWLQVMGDHARFIKDSLSVDETEEVTRARAMIAAFDGLLEHARKTEKRERLIEISREAYGLMQQLISFKLHLLQRHLIGKITIGLSPSFLSHMVNEAEEYLRVLGSLLSGQPAPVFHELHHHLVWLQDAYGHASSIASDLDMAEARLTELARTFDQHFREFYLKAVELAGYLRTNVKKFPALTRFGKEVELEMALFMQFLRELEALRLSKQALGVLSPLIADHMSREECYYLTKLSQVSEHKAPACDPTRPRVEA
ncbi:DUF2935 domain-containing protein [Paenibacillus tyrfis]|uniref:DUF2935 domain-containing protein n=1 Tax=Paenibacillus tyrfis TaxID=1501230 RepID=A0A081P673_9BACL|nr:DUF2935 domain-containing protein [Paenibacillus tyrfis]KEQ26196.1 hypothetical protein ET33_34570 [Paenibacillus tyrfis]